MSPRGKEEFPLNIGGKKVSEKINPFCRICAGPHKTSQHEEITPKPSDEQFIDHSFDKKPKGEIEKMPK